MLLCYYATMLLCYYARCVLILHLHFMPSQTGAPTAPLAWDTSLHDFAGAEQGLPASRNLLQQETARTASAAWLPRMISRSGSTRSVPATPSAPPSGRSSRGLSRTSSHSAVTAASPVSRSPAKTVWPGHYNSTRHQRLTAVWPSDPLPQAKAQTHNRTSQPIEMSGKRSRRPDSAQRHPGVQCFAQRLQSVCRIRKPSCWLPSGAHRR